MRVLVDIGAKRAYTYDVPEGTEPGDIVTVPGPPWDPRSTQEGTVKALGGEHEYDGEVQPVLAVRKPGGGDTPHMLRFWVTIEPRWAAVPWKGVCEVPARELAGLSEEDRARALDQILADFVSDQAPWGYGPLEDGEQP